MKTIHEKIIKRDDGSRVKLVVSICEFGRRKAEYKEDVEVCAKGKRTWVQSFDCESYSYRRLSTEERAAHVLACNRKLATEAEILDAKVELWQSLKPTV